MNWNSWVHLYCFQDCSASACILVPQHWYALYRATNKFSMPSIHSIRVPPPQCSTHTRLPSLSSSLPPVLSSSSWAPRLLSFFVTASILRQLDAKMCEWRNTSFTLLYRNLPKGEIIITKRQLIYKVDDEDGNLSHSPLISRQPPNLQPTWRLPSEHSSSNKKLIFVFLGGRKERKPALLGSVFGLFVSSVPVTSVP